MENMCRCAQFDLIDRPCRMILQFKKLTFSEEKNPKQYGVKCCMLHKIFLYLKKSVWTEI